MYADSGERNDLYEWKMMNQIKRWSLQSLSPDKLKLLAEIAEKRLGHKNLAYVEDAKIKLSSAPSVEIFLDFLAEAKAVHASRAEFEEALKENMEKIRRTANDCLKQSGVPRECIELVIMTGGSTEVPSVFELAREIFPNAEISADDKLSSVGLGLAYDSIRRFQ